MCVPLSLLVTFNFPFHKVISFTALEICTMSLKSRLPGVLFFGSCVVYSELQRTFEMISDVSKLDTFSDLLDKMLGIGKNS